MTDKHRVYLGLGSSLGDRRQHLREAIQGLRTAEIAVTAISSLYESPHLGLQPEDAERYPAHLNSVVEIETTLPPEELLNHLRALEEAGGRQRNQKWGPRTIDIDMLVYEGVTRNSEALQLPHPGIPYRAFVVLPLADLAPDLRLPDGRTIAELRNTPEIQGQTIERVNGL